MNLIEECSPYVEMKIIYSLEAGLLHLIFIGLHPRLQTMHVMWNQYEREFQKFALIFTSLELKSHYFTASMF